jgi:ParB family chromosome partitioning protein
MSNHQHRTIGSERTISESSPKPAGLSQALADELAIQRRDILAVHVVAKDHLGRPLGIDVAKWWRPTGANYLDRVPKSVTLAALEEVGGSVLASGYAKSKKAELSEAAERIFAGSIAPEEVKERALAWVPDAMRFAPAPTADPVEETPPWEDDATEEAVSGSNVAGPDEETGNVEREPETVEEPCVDPLPEAEQQRGGAADDASSAEQEMIEEAA